jgi:glyoxylase-like metal-dependent hydrolase (beta-lactamase superfamily II)
LLAFNCFLVREEDGFTLVDTNMPGSANAILRAAREHGAPIRRILLTHAHLDHTGSLDKLHALLPDAEVMISTRDARFLTGDNSLDANEPQSPLRGTYQVCTTKPTRLLYAGDKVGSLQVIASPGHTPGHIAFFDGRDGTLLAGDAYSTQGGISAGGTFKLLFPFPAMATWHKPTALHSAEALCRLQPTRLAVGHGAVLENPVRAMEHAIAEAKRSIGRDAYAAQKTH